MKTKIYSSPERINPPLIGSKFPDVTLYNTNGNLTRIYDYFKNRPTCVIFFRGFWCPYCRAHFDKLFEVEDEIKNLGYKILAIGSDRFEILNEEVTENYFDFPFISDSKMNAAAALGVAYHLNDELYEKYLGEGINFEFTVGEKHHILPVPGVYIVAEDGTIEFLYVNPNHRIRLDPHVLLSVLKWNKLNQIPE